MSTILEKLKFYFQNTPTEQIKKDWNASERYDNIGPSIDEFITQTKFYQKFQTNEITFDLNSIENIKNPKFTSDFFCLT